MKLNKSLLITPLALFALLSCSSVAHRYNVNDYVIKYEDKFSNWVPGDNGDFNILQITDIHATAMGDLDTHFAFIRKTVDIAKSILDNKLHLIVITGDLFTFATKDTVKELCSTFESFNVPWTLTFGNHDEQGYFSVTWMTDYMNALSKESNSKLLFNDLRNDDVFGNANFVIDLPKSENNASRQIIMIDSNRYNYGEGFGYDYIHYDQIDWYGRMYEKFINEDNNASSLAFFHIPVPEYVDALNDAKNHSSNVTSLKSNVYMDYHKGDTPIEITRDENLHKDKSDGNSKVNSGFFDALQKRGYTKGTFTGHCHTNNNCFDYRPINSQEDDNTVALCYGVKATDRVYCDYDMLGGQIIRYHDHAKEGHDYRGMEWFDLDLIYHKYTNLKEGI